MQVCLQKKYAPIVDFPWTILGKGQYNEYSKAREMDMITRPILTIAIPTYNGSKTIRNMLNLLLPQIEDFNKVEVLVSDNCSTDNTPQLIEEYQQEYPEIKYVRNRENIKTDGNILQCCRLARGKFIWHLSDDDVIIEDALKKIVSFLEENSDVKLVYLTTVDFRGHYYSLDKCQYHEPLAKSDICTSNKKEFIKFAGYYWGFMSSFISSTDKILEMENPEQYKHTYWLQSYLHAWCASGDQTKLGVVVGPCVGAGIYINNPNFDSSLVNGIYYKRMIDYMIKDCGFDHDQMYKLYFNRLILLGRHDIIKGKASGEIRINKRRYFNLTKNSIKAWITVYPLFFIPNFICRMAMSIYRHKKNLSRKVVTNRPE